MSVQSWKNLLADKHAKWCAPEHVLLRPSFVAVDFETANRDRVSACQIALVRIENGQVVDRFTSLIKPPADHNEFEFTYLHGIKPRHVRKAPTWPQIVSIVSQFVGNAPIYAHNAYFDSSVWCALDKYYNLRSVPYPFYCSYRIAQALVPGLENYKLPTVTSALVPGYALNHHAADSDAEACGLIISALQQYLHEQRSCL